VIDEVQLDVPFLVGLQIQTANDPAAQAEKIHAIALEIYKAADSQTLDLGAIADQVISRQFNGKDRILARLVSDAIAARVQRQLGLDPRSVPIPASQLEAVRQIVKAGAQSAMDAANRYGST
jgi:hypothetical protein